jgi:hypothetical protein
MPRVGRAPVVGSCAAGSYGELCARASHVLRPGDELSARAWRVPCGLMVDGGLVSRLRARCCPFWGVRLGWRGVGAGDIKI